MIPAADLGIIGAVGVVFVAASCCIGRRVYPVAIATLGALTALAPLLGTHRLHPAACLALAAGVGARLATINESRAQRLRKIILLTLPAFAVVLSVWGGYAFVRLSGAETRALAALPLAAPDAPNVLLIVLDTVRADHMSAYGYDRPTTRRLDEYARRGVQFDRAVSTAPWTLPSHASLFTGRWHSELTANADRRLDASVPVLAEFLREHGYVTGGFVGNTTNCNSFYGFDRGFIRYEDFADKAKVSLVELANCSEIGRRVLQLSGLAPRLGLDPNVGRKDAPTINRDVLSWLSGQNGAPFFAFVNYYDAHDPFILPDGVAPKYGPAKRTAEQDRVLRVWQHPDRRALPAAEAELIRDAYDDGIAYLDEQVGRLLDAMEARGLLENTIVIVTADHGENLGEHDLYSHGRSLYEPEVHVPLLVFGPRSVPSGRRVGATASLRDVAATVADLVGLRDASPFPGRSLARHWRSDDSVAGSASDPVLSEVFIRTTPGGEPRLSPALRVPMRAVFLGDKKYIWYGDGIEELFDLTRDPAEMNNLAAAADLPKYRAALGLKDVPGGPARGTAERGVAAGPQGGERR
jgi:arylsulfatase A-like enzyme